MTSTKRIAIIGSGPAGFTAAIYTSRAFIDTVVYAGNQPGGQLTLTTEVENFPGFPTGILGPDLMANMQKQAERFGSKILPKSVEKIEQKDNKFIVYDNYGQQDVFEALIVSSGASARYLGLPDEEKYHGNGYHSCATCDGFFYKGKNVIVVGGGDSAMEESNFLTKFAETVTIVHRSDTFKASPIMLKRAQDNPKIKWITNAEVIEMHGEGRLESVTLENKKDGTKTHMPIDGVFVAIGHTPNTDFAKGFLTMDELGYLQPEHTTMSNIPGVFVAGDVADRHYRQAITAAGEGCKAAMDAEKWLSTLQS